MTKPNLGKVAVKAAKELTMEETAQVLHEDADPFTTMAEVAQGFGLKKTQAQDLVKFIRAKYQPISQELHKVKVGDLVELIEDRALRALSHMDEDKLAASSARDLAVTMGILLEKRQLLRGEPTMIIGMEERMKLNEVVPELIKELSRRGMDVGDGVMWTEDDGPEVDITPVSPDRSIGRAPKTQNREQPQRTKNKVSKEVGEPTGETCG